MDSRVFLAIFTRNQAKTAPTQRRMLFALRSYEEYQEVQEDANEPNQAHAAFGSILLYIPKTLIAHGPGAARSGQHLCCFSVCNAKGMPWCGVDCDASNSILESPARLEAAGDSDFRFDFRRKFRKQPLPHERKGAPHRPLAKCQGSIHPCIDGRCEQLTFMQCLCSIPRVLGRSRALPSRHFLSLRSAKGTT